jgi:hypothetical protein
MDGLLAFLVAALSLAAFGVASVGWGTDSRPTNEEGDPR